MNTNKELDFVKKKIIYSITKFTTLDYPNKLSCIVWFKSCNMRCLYCYNDDLVFAKEGSYSIDDVLNFLKKRVGLLDGVVLSGGEASLYDLELFCKKIKDMGFLIKLDTNGLNKKLIKSLISQKLIDYIALDFKAPKYKFYSITKNENYSNFIKTLEYLIKIDFDFEIRTTVHPELLNLFDINSMIYLLKSKNYKNSYYLQNFLATKSNIGNLEESSKNIDRKKLLNRGLNVIWRD